jgi:aspartate kinase
MQSKWVVAKFGGSSVKDATAMLRCSNIIETNPLIKVVVISATQNTTNHLEFIAKAAVAKDEAKLNQLVDELISRHHQIGMELFTSPKVMEELDQIGVELKKISQNILQSSLTPKLMDELYAIGERMSSLLISDLLRLRIPGKEIVFLDARSLIKTNSDYQKAIPQIDLIAKNAAQLIFPSIDANTIFVTQGFIGSDLDGFTTTLGREGSDYSAALIGEAIDASLVQIWTDVPGVASSDPRIVSNVKFIANLSYDEATALATLGAKVLFPTTLLPTKRKNIPVFVGSSLQPDLGGTFINSQQDIKFSLKAVSALRDDAGLVVSFVGIRLGDQSNLRDEIIEKMSTVKLRFLKADELSLSFLVDDSAQDLNQVLIEAHKVLESY